MFLLRNKKKISQNYHQNPNLSGALHEHILIVSHENVPTGSTQINLSLSLQYVRVIPLAHICNPLVLENQPVNSGAQMSQHVHST